MTSAHALVVCAHCDAAYRRVSLAPDETAHCRRCGASIAAPEPDTDRLLALAATAAVLFAIATTNPILSVQFGDLSARASVWLAALSLGHGWITGAAIVLGLTMCCIPLLQIVLLLWLLAFARLGRRAPGCRQTLILLHALRPWSMTEVLLLAVLVAIIKLSSWVHVAVNVGAWALAGLAGILALLNAQPPATWWQFLDERPR
jgi:paraquat-inducible protein A